MVIIDIETAQDDLDESYMEYKGAKKTARLVDPEKIEAKKSEIAGKFALHPLTGKIILIGIATTQKIAGSEELLPSENHSKYYYRAFGTGSGEESETVMLHVFWKELYGLVNSEKLGGYPLVTFKGKSFDIPFLINRSIMLGVEMPPLRVYDFLKKYDNSVHVDMHLLLSEAFNKEGTLDEWAYRSGITTSLDTISGADIAAYYQLKQTHKIVEKNQMDVIKTLGLFKRIWTQI